MALQAPPRAQFMPVPAPTGGPANHISFGTISPASVRTMTKQERIATARNLFAGTKNMKSMAEHLFQGEPCRRPRPRTATGACVLHGTQSLAGRRARCSAPMLSGTSEVRFWGACKADISSQTQPALGRCV
jgi:hypothetical protein